jgi:hypothetical protein
MTEPINRKTEARMRTNAEGSADGAEGAPTPRQRAVIERYLKLSDSRPGAPRVSREIETEPAAGNQPTPTGRRRGLGAGIRDNGW